MGPGFKDLRFRLDVNAEPLSAVTTAKSKKIYHTMVRFTRSKGIPTRLRAVTYKQITGWRLIIVIWDIRAVSGKVNRFYLKPLALTLTFPCNFFRLAKLKNKKYDAII